MNHSDRFRRIPDMFRDNREAIIEYNCTVLPKTTMTGIIVTLSAFLGNLIYGGMIPTRIIYLSLFLICICIYAVYRSPKMKKYCLIGLYIEMLLFFILSIYLSFKGAPPRPAATMLLFLVVFPTIFIDKIWRVTLMEILFCTIHNVLAFHYKTPDLASLDGINTQCALAMGLAIGFFTLETKLKALDFERQLILEKETDILTSLANRRKLFETMKEIEMVNRALPTGVIMIDLDHFKQYNDAFGHAAGDECLQRLGSLLKTLEEEQNGDLLFYRYGGEEFCGFIWNRNAAESEVIVTDLQKRASAMKLSHDSITVSAGYVICDDPAVINYESWIAKADKALYTAKNTGRNRCIRYRTQNPHS